MKILTMAVAFSRSLLHSVKTIQGTKPKIDALQHDTVEV
jgi:hypothetical protein